MRIRYGTRTLPDRLISHCSLRNFGFHFCSLVWSGHPGTNLDWSGTTLKNLQPPHPLEHFFFFNSIDGFIGSAVPQSKLHSCAPIRWMKPTLRHSPGPCDARVRACSHKATSVESNSSYASWPLCKYQCTVLLSCAIIWVKLHRKADLQVRMLQPCDTGVFRHCTFLFTGTRSVLFIRVNKHRTKDTVQLVAVTITSQGECFVKARSTAPCPKMALRIVSRNECYLCRHMVWLNYSQYSISDPFLSLLTLLTYIPLMQLWSLHLYIHSPISHIFI